MFLYFPVFSCISLYFLIFSYISCIFLYFHVFSCIFIYFLYFPIFPYIVLYFPIFSYTFLYFPVFSYISYMFMYFPLFSCIFLYFPIFLYVFSCISPVRADYTSFPTFLSALRQGVWFKKLRGSCGKNCDQVMLWVHIEPRRPHSYPTSVICPYRAIPASGNTEKYWKILKAYRSEGIPRKL